MTLLLLPFVLSLLTFVAIKDDPSVIEHDALSIFIFIIFFASALIFWTHLYSNNKTVTFYKRPFLAKLERWWGIFTTTNILQLDSSHKVLVRREVLFVSESTCNVYLVNPNKKIHIFYLDATLDTDFSKLETLLNFTGLGLDPESNIFREINIFHETNTGQRTILQKSSLSPTKKILLICIFVLFVYLMNLLF